MRLEFAQAIVNAAFNAGCDVRLYKGYSGRGMYGKTTDGVVGEQSNILACVAQAAIDLNTLELAGTADGTDADAFVAAMANTSTDSMGRSEIIMY